MVEADEGALVRYPSRQQDHASDNSNIPFSSFQDACQRAILTNQPLHLQQSIEIEETIKLSGGQVLRIVGDPEGDNNICISSTTAHSLFLLNNASHLILDHISLRHLTPADSKLVGAAIQLRSKSKAMVKRAPELYSLAGFVGWTVQQSQLSLEDCGNISSEARSALVCFGSSKLSVNGSTITSCGVHGICTRGPCTLEIRDCQLTYNVVRALFCYAQAKVSLHNCTISNTQHAGRAALDIREGANIVLRECRVTANQGMGVLVLQPGKREGLNSSSKDVVEYQLIDCQIDNNLGGNVVVRKEDNDSKMNENNSSIDHIRGVDDSNFRPGDWWCSTCDACVKERFSDKCPQCSSSFSVDHTLTIDEIKACNQGVHEYVTDRIPIILKSQRDGGSPAAMPTWSVDLDDKGWLAYDVGVSQKLEEAFQQRKRSPDRKSIIAIEVQGRNYTVDISSMQQIAESGMLRKVRRS